MLGNPQAVVQACEKSSMMTPLPSQTSATQPFPCKGHWSQKTLMSLAIFTKKNYGKYARIIMLCMFFLTCLNMFILQITFSFWKYSTGLNITVFKVYSRAHRTEVVADRQGLVYSHYFIGNTFKTSKIVKLKL
jgi:hypothetical protein